MGSSGSALLFLVCVSWVCLTSLVSCVPSPSTMKVLRVVNRDGPYMGLVIPNAFEMNPLLLDNTTFVANARFPFLDIAGKRFHIGKMEKRKVIIVMTGLGMLNAGTTTSLLLALFDIEGVVHYGIAGNMNNNLHIADVTIPKYWAHTGLWNWQRYGDGPNDPLPFESFGDYTREIGYLHFGDYNEPSNCNRSNLLNNVWFQPEEVFSVTGTPEVRQHHFWVEVNKSYYMLAEKLKSVKLESCLNATTCLDSKPKVVMVERGASSNTFLDNAAYREFLYSTFDTSPIDMETAAVSLVCLANDIPFIAFRALSDLAGGSSTTNEGTIFASLATTNAITVLKIFFQLLNKTNM